MVMGPVGKRRVSSWKTFGSPLQGDQIAPQTSHKLGFGPKMGPKPPPGGGSGGGVWGGPGGPPGGVPRGGPDPQKGPFLAHPGGSPWM